MTDKTDLPRWTLDAVSAAAMIDVVEALRDDNQIHVDPEAAARHGYGHRTVNPGPTNLAYVLNMLMEAQPGQYPAKVSARFLDNVFSGEKLDVDGEADADGVCTARLRKVESGTIALDAVVTMRDRP